MQVILINAAIETDQGVLNISADQFFEAHFWNRFELVGQTRKGELIASTAIASMAFTVPWPAHVAPPKSSKESGYFTFGMPIA
ncbi:MAG: hypothetical protein E6H48_04605 [Betaproteobacteria bacterium]|nr:MAG: hypothetical protein E6H48_04605 [Betaproteobacteria bacterium]